MCPLLDGKYTFWPDLTPKRKFSAQDETWCLDEFKFAVFDVDF